LRQDLGEGPDLKTVEIVLKCQDETITVAHALPEDVTLQELRDRLQGDFRGVDGMTIRDCGLSGEQAPTVEFKKEWIHYHENVGSASMSAMGRLEESFGPEEQSQQAVDNLTEKKVNHQEPHDPDSTHGCSVIPVLRDTQEIVSGERQELGDTPSTR
jgi:hypothetical protein